MGVELVSDNDAAEGVVPADIVALLDEVRDKARAGEIRSLFVSWVSIDGACSATRWAGQSVDVREPVGILACLQHDLLRGRG